MKDLKWFGIGILLAVVFLFASYTLKQDQYQIKALLNNNLSAEDRVLTVGRANDAIALDPAVVTDEDSFRVTINIYDTLVRYDLFGSNIRPSLAESWTVSEDGLIWLFTIRDDVFFHDGTKLNAEAVVFNFNRWMDATSPYHAGHFAYWNMNFGGFPGLVDSVSTLSSDTVEIILKKPYAPFISTLAMPAFGIASPDAIMKYNEDLKYKPVGSGPFVFKSWDENGDITLDSNYNYWNGSPKVNQLIFKTIKDPDERVALMKSGEILIADNLTLYEIECLDPIDDILLLNRSYFNIGYLAMNMTNDHLKEKNVRKAIASLIDHNKMIDCAFECSTKAANSFVPPVIWGYNETITSIPFNVDYAKSLLKSVGKEDGFTIDLLVMDEPRTYFPMPLELASYLKSTLAKGNIDVNIVSKSWEEVLNMGQNGDYDMILAGWNGDVADPDNFLYTFFSSENTKTGIISNYSIYKNDHLDDLLTLARQATDQSFRNSLYREIQEIVYSDTPAIPLVHTIPTIGINKRVMGYRTSISGIEALNNVYLTKEP